MPNKEADSVDLNMLCHYFPERRGWQVISLPADQVDRRPTVESHKVRCIDRRFGVTSDGYAANSVPLAPAWLGAIDGIAAFFQGNAEARTRAAKNVTKALGYVAADHGDYAEGDLGCKFKKALLETQFQELAPLSLVETRVLRKKLNIVHVTLAYPTNNPVEGFLFNDQFGTTVLPDDGRFYTLDTWYPKAAGIKPQRFMPVVAKCAELILPENARRVYLANAA